MTRQKLWLILLGGALIVALAAYINRARLERVLIAASIYHAHIFTPPPSNPGESRWHRLQDAAQFYWDFSGIPVARSIRLKMLDPTLRPLVKEINRRQAAGEDMKYSMHIYREIRWQLNFTPDIAATQARIADLSRSLAQPESAKARRRAAGFRWELGAGN